MCMDSATEIDNVEGPWRQIWNEQGKEDGTPPLPSVEAFWHEYAEIIVRKCVVPISLTMF